MTLSDLDHKYAAEMETIIDQPIDHDDWEKMLHVFFEWFDEAENGDKEWQEVKRAREERTRKYFAYLLRNDLDRVFYGHPYPQPISERLKKIWPLAEYLYNESDPSGFLGPSSYELVYVMQAIQLSALLGNHDFDDLLASAAPTHHRFFPSFYVLHDDLEFDQWLTTSEYHDMFENGKPHPQIDYGRFWDDKEYQEEIWTIIQQEA